MLYSIVADAPFLHRGLKGGTLRAGDPQLARMDAESFGSAYAFMRASLEAKSPLKAQRRIQNNEWPLWFWPHAHMSSLRYALRHRRRQAPWHEAIALTFHLDPHKVLLSHYGLWHLCLMECPIFRTEAENDAYELDEPPQGSEAALGVAVSTWPRVFNPHLQSRPSADEIAWMGNTQTRDSEWQAVCWEAPRRRLVGGIFLGPNGRFLKLNARLVFQKLASMSQRSPKRLRCNKSRS